MQFEFQCLVLKMKVVEGVLHLLFTAPNWPLKSFAALDLSIEEYSVNMGILGSGRYQFIFSGLDDESILEGLPEALVCPVDGNMDSCFGVNTSLVGNQCGQMMVSRENWLSNDDCTQDFGTATT